MLKHGACCILLLTFLTSSGQDLNWVNIYDLDSSRTFGPRALTDDDAGNIYFSANFRDSVDIDPSASEDWLYHEQGNFIQKIDSSGNPQWTFFAHSYEVGGGFGFEALDVQGDSILVCAGQFADSIDLDPYSPSGMVYGNGNAFSLILIGLSTENGSLKWVQTFDGLDTTQFNPTLLGPAQVIIDEGSIYVNLAINGFIDIDTSSAINMVGDDHWIYVLMKLNADRIPLWTKNFDVSDLKVDIDEHLIYLAGTWIGYSGTNDVFVSKRNENGSLIRRISIEGAGVARFGDFDVQNGKIWVHGSFKNTLELNMPSNTDTLKSSEVAYFVAQYDTSLDFILAKAFRAAGYYSSIQYTHRSSLLLDGSKSPVISMQHVGYLDANPEPGNQHLIGDHANGNLSIIKLDTLGAFKWAASFTTTTQSFLGVEGILGHVSDSSVSVFGYHRAEVDFDPGTGSLLKNPTGFGDLFVLSLSNTNPPGENTGTEEYQVKNSKVYPNPARDVLRINLEQGKDADIAIYNAMGSKLKDQKIINGRAELNIQNLPTGVYHYTIESIDGSRESDQFIKVK